MLNAPASSPNFADWGIVREANERLAPSSDTKPSAVETRHYELHGDVTNLPGVTTPSYNVDNRVQPTNPVAGDPRLLG
jgi:hypothetical protein